MQEITKDLDSKNRHTKPIFLKYSNNPRHLPHIQKIIATFASLNAKACLGEVLEWLKRHAWKACNRQNRFAGSNPVLSAKKQNGLVLKKVIKPFFCSILSTSLSN